MNLDRCTPGQAQIITSLDSPLMVSAGAGSGKTFTLTQRVAYALDSSEGGAAIDGIDRVLAITFTRKAADELKSRIKGKLLEMGLADQALMVDDAWISTIHGMCSRILQEHALEIGIDPNFEVITEAEGQSLRQKAFDWVVKRIENGDDERMRAYLQRLPLQGSMFNADSIEGRFNDLMARVDALPSGLDKVCVPNIDYTPSELLRSAIDNARRMVNALESYNGTATTPAKIALSLRSALEDAYLYLEQNDSLSFDDERFDSDAFASVFYGFPHSVRNIKGLEYERDRYLLEYSELSIRAEAGFASVDIECGLQFAQLFTHAYSAFKGRRRLDNTDLLRYAYHALSEYPEIAATYRDLFQLIMIDEFQDTDALQVAIVDLLAKPGKTNVCTVGDAQQSIYRFRGADVNVFFSYAEYLEADADQPQFISLPDNFRSHADVLSFVESIFSQPDVFGDRFLSLKAKGEVNTQANPVFDDFPRISLGLFEKASGGPNLEYVRTQSAKSIAKHFAELRSRGVKPGEMALLLGSMSRVGLYAQALRDEGFEYMVTGGSTFSKAYEVQLVANVLRFLSNQHDEEALYQVLASPLFNLSDDALLHFATYVDADDSRQQRSIAMGFSLWHLERELALLERADVLAIDFAKECLDHSLTALRRSGLKAAVEQLLRESGWYMRLEHAGAEGVAQVGNVQKALRMLGDVEERGLGVARTVDEFSQIIETVKTGPGLLATEASDFIQIMTIHNSKGLEFGHVAVAELSLKATSSAFCCENIDGMPFIAARAVLQDPAKSRAKDLRKRYLEAFEAPSEIVAGMDGASHLLTLSAYAESQELEEARRKLYVALTRAVESLYVAVADESLAYSDKNPAYENLPILHDMHAALGWDSQAANSTQLVEYGGSAPCRVQLNVFSEAEDEEVGEFEDVQDFLVPSTDQPLDAPLHPFDSLNADVVSPSSLPDDEIPSSVSLGAGSSFDAPMGLDDFGLSANEDGEATDLGNAFHRLAQCAIDAHEGSGPLERPSDRRIAIVEDQYRLTDFQSARLRCALDRWFGSDCAGSFAAHGSLQAEVPFMVAIDGNAPFYLEGEIDALSIVDKVAYLIDYKTGGFLGETDELLHLKHGLQAKCYAYALLCQGLDAVHAQFVRVEQGRDEDPDQPQVVEFEFTAADKQRLEDEIRSKYRQLRG